MIIAVIGRASDASAAALAQAEAVGHELAQRGCDLIGGVMEAACRGAKSAGGRTIGVLPGNDRRDANPYVDVAIVTGIGRALNLAVVLSADAVIAIDGSYGTLSEIAYALEHGRPVIGLATWTLAPPGEDDAPIRRAADAAEAVSLAIELAAANERPQLTKRS